MAIRSGRFGYSFTALRALEFLCFAAIVGLCAIFAAEVNRLDGPHQPSPIALALAVSVIFATYALFTLFGHLCRHIPYITTTIGDIIAMILLVITAVYIGRPLTRLDCTVVGDFNEHIDSLGDVMYSVAGSHPDGVHKYISGAKDKFKEILGVKGLESVNGLAALGTTREEVRSKLGDYPEWVGRVEDTCRMMKAAWGLTILLAILFTTTAIISFILYQRVHSIRTFHVEENEDGTYVYHTQYVPASLIREESVESEDRNTSAEYDRKTSTESAGDQHRMV